MHVVQSPPPPQLAHSGELTNLSATEPRRLSSPPLPALLTLVSGSIPRISWQMTQKAIYHPRNHSRPSCHGWAGQVPVRYWGCCRQRNWTASHYLSPVLGSTESVLHSWWCTYIPSSQSANILINFHLIFLFSHLQTTFELTANAQLWPRSLNTVMGGTSSSIYLIINDLGSNSGEGLDFVNGLAFLERFYAVFDTANKRVGLATTSFTDATTN